MKFSEANYANEYLRWGSNRTIYSGKEISINNKTIINGTFDNYNYSSNNIDMFNYNDKRMYNYYFINMNRPGTLEINLCMFKYIKNLSAYLITESGIPLQKNQALINSNTNIYYSSISLDVGIYYIRVIGDDFTNNYPGKYSKYLMTTKIFVNDDYESYEASSYYKNKQDHIYNLCVVKNNLLPYGIEPYEYNINGSKIEYEIGEGLNGTFTKMKNFYKQQQSFNREYLPDNIDYENDYVLETYYIWDPNLLKVLAELVYFNNSILLKKIYEAKYEETEYEYIKNDIAPFIMDGINFFVDIGILASGIGSTTKLTFDIVWGTKGVIEDIQSLYKDFTSLYESEDLTQERYNLLSIKLNSFHSNILQLAELNENRFFSYIKLERKIHFIEDYTGIVGYKTYFDILGECSEEYLFSKQKYDSFDNIVFTNSTSKKNYTGKMYFYNLNIKKY